MVFWPTVTLKPLLGRAAGLRRVGRQVAAVGGNDDPVARLPETCDQENVGVVETPVAPLAGLLSVGAASLVTAGCVVKLFLFDQ